MKNKKISQYLIITFLAIVMAACTSTEPLDYTKMNISRMDLSGAVSLALVKDGSTRAIEGTYLSAGLYKVDAKGNITAVAVFFTVDKDGKNYTEHQHPLKVRPDKLYDITDNFCIAAKCEYYDDKNDYVYVPYDFLLIRKSDGRIWSIHNQIGRIYSGFDRDGIIDLIYPNYELKKHFTQNNKGELYYAKGEVYKFNLDTNTPSLEQITKNGSIEGYFQINDQGIIWNKPYPYAESISVTWPYSGYITSDRVSLLEMEFEELEFDASQYGFETIEKFNIGSSGKIDIVSINNNPLIIFDPTITTHFSKRNPNEEELFLNFCDDEIKPIRADFLEIGSTPRDIKMQGKPIVLQESPNSHRNTNIEYYNRYNISAVYPAKNKVLVADNSDKTWLTLIDLDKREWKWLRQLDYKFGNGAGICYEGQDRISTFYIDYANKIWIIDNHVDHFGCYWIDLENFEDGFVPFDFTMPDFLINSYDNTYSGAFGFTYDEKGNFKSEWINPNDGNNYYLTIDILSGHGEITMEEPDMYFDTLVPLN